MANNSMNIELRRAVFYRKLDEVKALLSAGASVYFRDEQSDTLLHHATSVEIIKELLLRGADVNARNMYNETPLHHAITLNRGVECVRELLKNGADVNATNRKGNTALNHAVKKRPVKLEVVKELLEYGARIDIRNRERRLSENHFSSLDNAIYDLPCAKLLIKCTLIRDMDKGYGKIIDLSPYKGCVNFNELASYTDGCVSEILQMKNETKNGLPLYEIVKKNLNVYVPCNNPLSVRLAKIDYSERYPIYCDIILDKVKPFLERADLLNKLSKIQFYTKLDVVDQDIKEKKIVLNLDSAYNITEYLSNEDLLNFIIAFDDSNKRSFESFSSFNNLIEPRKRLNETSINNDTKHARLE